MVGIETTIYYEPASHFMYNQVVSFKHLSENTNISTRALEQLILAPDFFFKRCAPEGAGKIDTEGGLGFYNQNK